jgi:hypothetical protein
MSMERRRSPRVEMVGQLHGHAVTFDLPVTVRDISLGGMSIQTPVALPVGATHTFNLTLGDGALLTLVGRVLRSSGRTELDGTEYFVSGVQFVDDEPAEGGPVGDIIGKMT